MTIDLYRRRPYLVRRSNTINEESPTFNAYRRSSRLISEDSPLSPLIDWTEDENGADARFDTRNRNDKFSKLVLRLKMSILGCEWY